MNLTANEFVKKLLLLATPEDQVKNEKVLSISRDPNSSEDIQIEIGMGKIFALAKEYMEMPLSEIEKLLESPIHKVRVGAVSIMDWQARSKKTSDEQRKNLYELYIRRHDRINTWDLVDRSAIYVVGKYLLSKPHDILYSLAGSSKPMERRTAIVSTAYFISNDSLEDTYKIAELLMEDQNELVQKAAGWMLRYAGDKDLPKLRTFLDTYAVSMPRFMLRNSIEKLSKEQKKHYLEAYKKSK